MKKLLAMMLVAIMALSMLNGCARSDSGATEKKSTEATSNESSGSKTIGMVIKNPTTEYIQGFIIGAQKVCDKYGYELKVVDGQADSMKIMDAIDNFILQGIDAFILAGAEDLKTLVPGIERLNEENIPVYAVDTCPEGGHVDMFITNDIVASSAKAAAQMIEGIKEKNNGEVPEGVIIEITGSLVDMYTTDCNTGFMSVMEQYPQLKIVQGEGHWNNDDSYARTADLLTRYGDEVVGVYCHTPDIMGSGVVSAIEAADKNPADYFISGICIGAEGLSLLKEGKLYAVVEQPALDMAGKCVEYIHMMFEGEQIPQVGDVIEEEGALWSPAKVIENEYAESGATMILESPLVPQECPVDDERLYENVIAK
ncbi:MAG: sugar ABC transporter substrate-binding protein [Eubacteriales bacterium]|nr:sugar ABC transporter substrate-binding protein [Eubacteriales bacterium]